MSPRRVDRMTRVNELIKRELAGLIETDRVWAGNILVSVTTVNTGTDLRNATAGISIFGGTPAERRKIMDELESRKAKWQEDLAAELGFARMLLEIGEPEIDPERLRGGKQPAVKFRIEPPGFRRPTVR